MTAQHVSWSTIQKDLTATPFQVSKEDAVAPAYSVIKQPFAFTFTSFGIMIERLFLDVQATAQKRAGGATALAVNLDTTAKNLQTYVSGITELTQQIKEAKELKSDEKASEKSIATHVPVRLGLSAEEQIQCVKKAQEIALKWFTEKSVPLSNGKKYWMAPTDEILANKWHSDPEMHRFFYRQFKLRSSKEPTSFTKADLAAFGVKEGEKTSDPAELNCAAFAFLQIREMRAKEYIFQGKDVPMKDLQKILKSWGYVPVETPAPNDLVMYIDSEGNATHLGRFLVSGQVESKLGIRQPYFHWHNIFDVPSPYGNRVVFMRKS